MTLALPTPGAIATPFTVRLVKGNRRARVTGERAQAARSHYFMGHGGTWTDVRGFGAVRVSAAYPGIDMLHSFRDGEQLEYDFIVAPGADPDRIRLRFDGSASLTVNADGDLTVTVGGRTLIQRKPVLFQMGNGGRQIVEGGFRLFAANEVGFSIGEYDRTRELVIDPAIFYGTVMGTGQASAVAVHRDVSDGRRYVYVVGGVGGVDFPLRNALQPDFAGAFVAKFDPDRVGDESLIWSTYLWSGEGMATDVAVDSGGNAVVVGTTANGFPIVGGFQSTWKGPAYFPYSAGEGFVAKIRKDGAQLQYSSYLGGSEGEQDLRVAVDASDRVYVTTYTYSRDLTTTPGAYQDVRSGVGLSGFIARVDTTATGAASLTYATYFGGSRDDRIFGLAVDPTGHVYVTGITWSEDFPVVRAYQTSVAGADFCGLGSNYDAALCHGSDAFIAKLDLSAPRNAVLEYSTYLGGPNIDAAHDVVVDSAGNVYITGMSGAAFPITSNAYQAEPSSSFVAKLDPGASGVASLTYSTYLPYGWVSDLAVDSGGDVYLGGVTHNTGFTGVNGSGYQGAGLFQSLDAGASWERLNSGATSLWDVAIDRASTPPTLYGAGSEGLSKSTDGGLTWHGLVGLNVPRFIRSVAVDPIDPATLYVTATEQPWNDNGPIHIYRSTDRGASWVPTTSPGSISTLSASGVRGYTELFAGTSDGLFRSTDAGNTWTPLYQGWSVETFAITDELPRTMYMLGHAGGSGVGSVQSSTDEGATWTVAPGEFWRAAISLDASTTPVTVRVFGVVTDSTSGDELTLLLQSTDRGATWTEARLTGRGGERNIPGPNITSLGAVAIGNNLLFGGIDGLGSSTDGGATWLVRSDCVSTKIIAPGGLSAGQPIYAICIPHAAEDGFVAKLNSSGTALVFSTAFGGFGGEVPYGLAVDESGSIFVVGTTTSTTPPLSNAYAVPPTASTPQGRPFLIAFGGVLTAAPPGCSSNCAATAHMQVETGSLDITIPNVTSAGLTTVNPVDDQTLANFQLTNNLGAYDVSTEATYTASTETPLTLCFEVRVVSDPVIFNNLRVLHIVNGVAEDATVSRDFANHRVCAAVTSLSPFVIVKGPELRSGASALTFEPRPIGTASAAQPLTVTNTGGAPLSLNAVSVSGDFRVTSGCSNTIAPGTSCELSVTFVPAGAGARTGTLTIATNGASSPTHIPLRGSGLYEFGGFRPPLLKGDAAVIRQGNGGRTIPVKFQLFAAGVPVPDAVATISTYRVSDVATGTVDTTDLTGDAGASSTSGNRARYDLASQQYIFNLSTSSLSTPGTYRVVLRLDDGSMHTVDFSLR